MLVQMGIHEEELLWLAKRVKHLKGTSEEGVRTTVQLEAGSEIEEPCQRHVQISRDRNGLNISTDAEPEYEGREG